MPFDQIYWNNYGSLPDIAERGHYVSSGTHDIRFGQTKTEDSHSTFSFCGKRRDRIQEFYHMYFADDRNPYNYRNRNEFYQARYNPDYRIVGPNGEDISGYVGNDKSQLNRIRYQINFNGSYVFGWPKLNADQTTSTDAYYGIEVNSMTVDDIENVYPQKRNYSNKKDPSDGSQLNEGTTQHSTLTDDLFQAQNRESCHWLSNTAHANNVENPFMGIHIDNPLTVTADKNFLGYMLILKRKRYHYDESKIRLVHYMSPLAIDPRPFRQNKTKRKEVFLGSENVYFDQKGDPFWNSTLYNFVQVPGWTWTIGMNWDRKARLLADQNFRAALPDASGNYRAIDKANGTSNWTPTWKTDIDCTSFGTAEFDYESYLDASGNQIYQPPEPHHAYEHFYVQPGNRSFCVEFKLVWVSEPSGCPGSITGGFEDNLCTEFFWGSTSNAFEKVQDQAEGDGDLKSDSWITLSEVTAQANSGQAWTPPNVLFLYYPEQGGAPYEIVEQFTEGWWNINSRWLMKKYVQKEGNTDGASSWEKVGFGQPKENWNWIFRTARAQNNRMGCYLKKGSGCGDWSVMNPYGYGATKAFKPGKISNTEYHDWMDGCFWTVDHWIFTKYRSSDPDGWSTMKDSGKLLATDKWYFRGMNSNSKDPRSAHTGSKINVRIGRPVNSDFSNAFSNAPGNVPFGAITDQYRNSNTNGNFWDVDNYDENRRTYDYNGFDFANYDTTQMLWTRIPKIGNPTFRNLNQSTSNSDMGNYPIVDIHEVRHTDSYWQPNGWQTDYPDAHPYGVYWNLLFAEGWNTYDRPSRSDLFFHKGENIRNHRWSIANKHWEAEDGDEFWKQFVGVLGNTVDVYDDPWNPYTTVYKDRVVWKDSIPVKEATIHPTYSKRTQIDTGSIYLKNITIKKGSKVLPAKEDVLGEWVEQTSSEIYTDRSSKIVASNGSNKKVISFKNMYKNKTNICKRYFDTSFQIKFGSSSTWHLISAVNNSSITLSEDPGTLTNSSFTLRIPRGSRDENYTWGNYKLSSFDGDAYTSSECWALRNSEDVSWADLFVATFKTTFVDMELPKMWNNAFYGFENGNQGKANRHPFFSNELSESLHIRNGFTNVAYWQDSYWNNRGGQFGHISSKVKGNVSWDGCSWVKYWETAHTAYDTYTITHNGEKRILSVDWNGENGNQWYGPNPPYTERYGKGEWSPPLLNANGDYSHVRPPATDDSTQSSSAGWFSNLDNFTMEQGIAAPVIDYQGNGINFRINSFIFGGLDKASGSIWPGYGYDQSVKLSQPVFDTNIENQKWAELLVEAFGVPNQSGNVPLMPYLDKPWMAFCSFSRFPGLYAYYQYGIQSNHDYDIFANNMNLLENKGMENPTLDSAAAFAGNYWLDNSTGKAIRKKSFEHAEDSRLKKSLLHPWVLATYGYDNDYLGWGNKTAGKEPHFITIYDSNEYIKKGTTFTVALQQGGTAFNRELFVSDINSYLEVDELLGMGRTTQDLDEYELFLVAK